MAITSVEPQGRFAQALVAAMEEKQLGLRELSVATESTYEHMRKLIKGLAFPSKYLLKELSKTLGLKLSEMEMLVTQDKMEHRLGDTMHKVLGHSPRSAKLEQLLPHLTDDQFEMFEQQIRSIVRANRQKKA